MKKVFSVFVILGILMIGCGDKIQNAKTSSAFLKVGIEVAQTGLNVGVIEQKKLCDKVICLEKDPTKGPEYKDCMLQDHANNEKWLSCYNTSFSKRGWDFYMKLKPQLSQAVNTLDAIVLVAEQSGQGQSVDFITPIKHCVCLLTQLVVWLPDSWKEKVEVYVKMVGNFTCGSSANIQNPTLNQAKKIRDILNKINSMV